MNKLYYGDNLEIIRKHISDQSVDLIYLDPPFNSKAGYNILFKEPAGESSKAQITAFEDTWHWTEETEKTYQEIIETASANIVEMMRAFRRFINLNDMMAYLTMMCIRLIELKRVLKDTGSVYLHCDPTASHYLKILMDAVFGKKNFRNEIVWHYKTGGTSKRHLAKKHDIILFYTKTDDYHFDPLASPDTRTEKSIARAQTPKGARISANDVHKIPMDVWQIQALNPMERERLGYPTQKPAKLLSRIIKLSCPKNGTVLDPFVGCGTTVSACEDLNINERFNLSWIGIDITHLAVNLIKFRLKNTFDLDHKKDYQVVGEPEDLTGAIELASQNRFQFQWWALSMINARPYGDKKKGADRGIDGFIYFQDGKKEYQKVIVQVKSGKVGVKDIRELGYVIDREDAAVGIFITLNDPTKPMVKEAAAKGLFRSNITKKDYPKIQILTIEDIFKGAKPSLPEQFRLSPYKKADRANVDNQNDMFEDGDNLT